MLRPPRGARAPERLLLYGGAGVGKSSCWIDIAVKMEEAGSPGKMYVIDTDNAVEAMFEFYPNLEERVVYWNCYDWDDLTRARDELMKIGPDRDDWTVVDLISMPYTEVRRHYTEIVYGQNLEEYLLETATLVNQAKAAKERGHERQFGDWSGQDWDHMGKIYLTWEQPLTLRNRSNVLCVAEERELQEARGATAEQLKRYRRAGGFKPYVNKTLEHRMRTVLRVSAPGSSRELTLAKDRYREEIWEEKANRNMLIIGDMHDDGGFVKSYLIDVAGWRMRPTKGE